MTSNYKKKAGSSASTSFRRDEVEVMVQLFKILRRGGTPSVVMRSPSVASVQQKFRRMKLKLDKEVRDNSETV